jgi:hypothetical protein
VELGWNSGMEAIQAEATAAAQRGVEALQGLQHEQTDWSYARSKTQ